MKGGHASNQGRITPSADGNSADALERAMLAGVGALRLFFLAQSAVAVVASRRRYRSAGLSALLLGIVAGDSCWVARRLWRLRGTSDTTASWVDVSTTTGALLMSAANLRRPVDRFSWRNWPYNLSLSTAAAAGLALPPTQGMLAGATLAAACGAIGCAGGGGRSLARVAFVYGSNYLGYAGVPASIGRRLRRMATETDRLRQEAASTAAVVVTQQERRRLYQTVHRELATALDELLDGWDGDEEGIRRKARAESLRLRRWIHEPVTGDRDCPVDVLQAVGLLAEEFVREGLAVEVNSLGVTTDCSDQVVAAFTAAARLALANVAEHSMADRAIVALGEADGWAAITIRDHGVGFADTEPVVLRLRGLVEPLGGLAEVSSASGRGTRVVLRLPGPPVGVERVVRGPALPKGPGDDGREGRATAEVERVLLRALLAVRVLVGLQAVIATRAGWGQLRSRRGAALNLAVVSGESAWLAQRCWSTRRCHDPRLVWLDTLAALGILVSSALATQREDRPTWLHWGFQYSLSAAANAGSGMPGAVEGGLAAGALAGTFGLTLAPAWGVQREEVFGSLLTAVPTYLWFFGAARMFAGLLRRAGRDLDDAEGEAVHQAGSEASLREAEHQRRLMHDSVLQSLEAVAGAWVSDREVLRQRMAQDLAAVRQALDGQDANLEMTLGELLDDLGAEVASLGLCLEVMAPRHLILAPEYAAALGAATREALVNVRKHAGVNSAVVRGAVVDGGLEVLVDDDGRGVSPGTLATTSGFGVYESIMGRMAEVGGRAELSSSPGGGTRVRLWVPL